MSLPRQLLLPEFLEALSHCQVFFSFPASPSSSIPFPTSPNPSPASSFIYYFSLPPVLWMPLLKCTRGEKHRGLSPMGLLVYAKNPPATGLINNIWALVATTCCPAGCQHLFWKKTPQIPEGPSSFEEVRCWSCLFKYLTWLKVTTWGQVAPSPYELQLYSLSWLCLRTIESKCKHFPQFYPTP